MFEVMLLASFVLITLGQSVEQLRAAIIYVVLNILGSWLLLLGIGLLYKLTGTLNFALVAQRITEMQGKFSSNYFNGVFNCIWCQSCACIIHVAS